MYRNIAIYPGTFDPFTRGHMDIVHRALEIFDTIIVTIVINSGKSSLFSVAERIDIISRLFDGDPRIQVTSFDGLLVDYVVNKESRVILRGLRAVTDFELEFQLAQMNRTVCEQVETLFLMTSPEFAFLSSSLVKEVGRLGGDISKFVAPLVMDELKKKLSED